LASAGGGNGALTVRPGRGGGSDASRSASGRSSFGADQAGSRASTRPVSASPRDTPAAAGVRTPGPGSSAPSPRRNRNPSPSLFTAAPPVSRGRRPTSAESGNSAAASRPRDMSLLIRRPPLLTSPT